MKAELMFDNIGGGSAECKCICLAATDNTPIIDTNYVTDSYVTSGSNRIHTLTKAQ